jgi:hypothetical protein
MAITRDAAMGLAIAKIYFSKNALNSLIKMSLTLSLRRQKDPLHFKGNGKQLVIVFLRVL